MEESTMEIPQTFRQLQMDELDILLQIDAFCKKHNIVYYLGEGTLLGAARHKGFIPWDDDIDILMPRDEYERFLKIAPEELAGACTVQHASTVKNYWSPFIKVRSAKNPHGFVQTHIAHLTTDNGPCIDIFPIDNVPQESSFWQRAQSCAICTLRSMLSYKLGLYQPKTKKRKVLKFAARFVPVDVLHWLLNRFFVMMNRQSNAYMVNLASYYSHKKQTVPKEVYGRPVMLEFESHLLPAPAQYDFLLHRIYGDYMKLPPEKKRKIAHHFVQEGTGQKSELSPED